jgi:hypothetical protein
LPLPPPPLPTPPAKCPDGSFANAYGLCRTATNPCSQGMVARGNFCFPLTNPTCGPGTTPTATAGGGVLCLPPRIACGRGTHLADGKCVSDPQPCGSGEMRNSAGQCVKNIAVPICGAGAVNVGGRCAPVDQHTTPTITIKDPGLRHPSVPITPRTPTVKVSNNFPTKLVTPVATNNPKPPYVIGRGGHGLNLYNSGQGSTPSNRNSKSTVPFRTGGQPILHGLPAMGMSKSQGQTIR